MDEWNERTAKANEKRKRNESIYFNVKQCKQHKWITGDNVIWIKINLLITLNRVHSFKCLCTRYDWKVTASLLYSQHTDTQNAKPFEWIENGQKNASQLNVRIWWRRKKKRIEWARTRTQFRKCEWNDHLWQVKYLVCIFLHCDDNPSSPEKKKKIVHKR